MISIQTASERLRAGQDEVLQLWEQRSRTMIQSAKEKDSHTVRDELSHFLTALVVNLQAGRTNVVENERISAQHHGQQRAELTGYTLMEAIKEYSLLRTV